MMTTRQESLLLTTVSQASTNRYLLALLNYLLDMALLMQIAFDALSGMAFTL